MTMDAAGTRLLSTIQRNLTKSCNVLLGICAGMVADGVLNDQEIAFLATWLADHDDVASAWPGNAIADRLRAIMADGVISEAERSDLLALLQSLSGNDFAETGAASPDTPAVVFDTAVDVVFPGKTFCFTGTFAFGVRSKCAQATQALGGLTTERMTLSLDYLVVGASCAKDWVSPTFGNKIKAAMQHGRLVIIDEQTWVEALAQAVRAD